MSYRSGMLEVWQSDVVTSHAPQLQSSGQESQPPQQTLQRVLEANNGSVVPDLLLLLVHAVMLETGFVGAYEVCAPPQPITMREVAC